MQELLVSSLAQTDALAKLLIGKGLITREEFMQKTISCLGQSIDLFRDFRVVSVVVFPRQLIHLLLYLLAGHG